MIKTATENDIPRIVGMVERLAASVRGPQAACRVRTGETLAGLMGSPDGAVFVSERGFIAGCITQTIISPAPVAIELGWYAEDRSGLRLLTAFEAWAKSRGATLIKMTCNSGVAQALLERRGYRTAEIQMVK